MTHHSPLMNWINGFVGFTATGFAAKLAQKSITMTDVKEVFVLAGVFIGVLIGAFTLFNAYMDARHKWRRDRIEQDADEIHELGD